MNCNTICLCLGTKLSQCGINPRCKTFLVRTFMMGYALDYKIEMYMATILKEKKLFHSIPLWITLESPLFQPHLKILLQKTLE